MREPSRPRPPTRLASPLAVLVTALCLAAPASALGLNLLGASRSIFAEGTSFCPGCGPNGEDEVFSNDDGDQSLVFGLFDAVAISVGSSADQTSTVSANELSGEGSIGLGFTGSNSAYSNLSVNFQVTATEQYALDGEFLGDFVDTLTIALDSTSGPVFSRQGFGPETFEETFLLEVGETYTLSAQVSGSDFSGIPGGAGWSFVLTPEPSTALLVGVGLWGLAVGGRRPS